ncbi:MAG: DUF5110 domain-containing protein, partial [Bacteroidales bacterium]|nr:DUF5110 domain-containing protein [Bacteroidales bacterium]
VYLPQSQGWFDFWTGKFYKGGQTIQYPSPIDIMPLFVKAGSIIPMGPYLQFTTEKPANPIELRIYMGADASFVLYEDENDNYNYEKGSYTTIPFLWDNEGKTLTIGQLKGKFPGMLEKRVFKIVFVDEHTGIGVQESPTVNQIIEYTGNEIVVKH